MVSDSRELEKWFDSLKDTLETAYLAADEL